MMATSVRGVVTPPPPPPPYNAAVFDHRHYYYDHHRIKGATSPTPSTASSSTCAPVRLFYPRPYYSSDADDAKLSLPDTESVVSDEQSDDQEAYVKQLMVSIETCVSACAGLARVAESWETLTKQQTHLYFVESSSSTSSSSSSTTDASFPSMERRATFPSMECRATWPLCSTTCSRSPDERWTKFPAAGLLPPSSPPPPRLRAPLPPGWIELEAPDGWPIFVNASLKQTSWSRPRPPLDPDHTIIALGKRFEGRVVNVQSHYAFVRTDPPIFSGCSPQQHPPAPGTPVSKHANKHAKRAGDIFVYCADVDFELRARQRVTFQLAEYRGRVKAVAVLLVEEDGTPHFVAH